jgi:proline iminopeptidase
MKTLAYFFLLLAAMACTSPKEQPCPPVTHKDYFESKESGIQSGGVKMISIQTLDSTFQLWTKTIGNNPKHRLLVLSGGPGISHEYLECFESFLPKEGIELIYLDQLGCGNSDNPNDTAFWDLDRYVEELEQVRQALQLDESNFFLLGHSWGGILAMQYALKYGEHIKGLIVSNMMSDAVAYGNYADSILGPQMPAEVLQEIRNIEARKDFSNPRYMALLEEHYYAKHICRIPPNEWPEPITRAMSKLNSSLYVTMQGPSEFGISGKLERWDVSQQLSQIKTPTLVVGATHDTMDPKHMQWMATQFPKGQFHLCEKGSHMCMWDDQQSYFKALNAFILSL